jgi:hypothetical protein
MLQVNENELVQRFRQPGGAGWVGFVNELLWAACWQMGIPEGDVRACLRTEIPDGGVDTRVMTGSPTDMTGFLREPSIWQFKAADEATVTRASIKKEVNKPFAKERIMAGDAYRLCVCAHFADDSRTEIEAWLKAEVEAINVTAPTSRLLSAADVAKMAGHFPSFVQSMRGTELQQGTFTLQSWGDNATARTKNFISNAAYEAHRERILAHVDPAQEPQDPVLPIIGLSGIGKTRCVYEALDTMKAASGLVLYIDNEQVAGQVATLLANTPHSAAILVVDDCSSTTRFRLMQSLAGHRKRVRVLTIQHESRDERHVSPEISIERYSDADIEKIMRANYPNVAPERMRAYVVLSDGYLRLAIDLCDHDSAILQAQGLGPAELNAKMYYEERVGTHREHVSAIALFTRVGRQGDVAGELDAICTWLGLDRKRAEQSFVALKDSPGFVQRSAIYYRISPELIAMQAFDDAWRRWASDREEQFLSEVQKLPEELQKSFLTRVSRSAKQEVREIVRNFFRSFAQRFDGESLGRLTEILQLRALIEVDPDFYLPFLSDAVTQATDRQLAAPKRNRYGWDTRRQLVYIGDQLAQFRSYFSRAEAMLFRLAQCENEPDIGNNATKTWQRLFRPQLSGTPLPFEERLRLLETRLPQPHEPLLPLFRGALEDLYDFHGTRLLGSALFAGKIPESEWRFRSQEDVVQYIRATLTLLFKIASERTDGTDADAASGLLLNGIDSFVRQGFLEEVIDVIPAKHIPQIVRAELHSRFSLFLGRAEKFGLPPALAKNDRSADIVKWLDSFPPLDLVGRLIVEVSSSSWDHNGKEAEWREHLIALAKETLAAYRAGDSAFTEVLSWLHSEKARGAFDFGFELGKLADDRELFIASLQRALASDRADFVRGIVAGNVEQSPENLDWFNEQLDELQQTHSAMAFYLAQVLGDRGKAFQRTVDMVRSDRLSPLFLKNFTVWVGNRRTTLNEVATAVETLRPFVKRSFPGSAEAMIEFIGYQYHGQNRQESPYLDSSFDELAWTVVSETITESAGQAFWWGEIVKHATPTVGPERAAKLLVSGIIGPNFHIRDTSDGLLGSLAAEYPREVISALGDAILSDDSWRLNVARSNFFLSVPIEVISEWLDKEGVRGALALASHVPAPSVSDDGEPILHPLTALLLEKFGEEESVFTQFTAGVHNLQTYMGDIAGQKEQEARNAEKFIHHPIPAVRRWAELEIEAGRQDAARWRAQMDNDRD